MIKIIQEGNKDNAPVYTRVCPECKCKFEYQYKDTFTYGWNGGYQAISCPTCNYPVLHTIGGASEDINHPKLTDED